MEISISTAWLIAGAILILLELTVIQGIGFLFAGLGALCVGGMLIAGLIAELSDQFIWFFIFTAIWALVLWKPLKRFIEGKDSGFDDMVGSTAIVINQPLEKGKLGEVKWSGAIMKCEYDNEGRGKDVIAPGAEVVIAGISKGVLIVKEKFSD